MKKPGLYANMNARKEAGTSRPKGESTIDKKTYSLMTRKAGPFKEQSPKPPMTKSAPASPGAGRKKGQYA